jgi:hypothetical protein
MHGPSYQQVGPWDRRTWELHPFRSLIAVLLIHLYYFNNFSEDQLTGLHHVTDDLALSDFLDLDSQIACCSGGLAALLVRVRM